MERFSKITLSAVIAALVSVGCGGDDSGAGFASGAFGGSSGPPDSSGMIFDGIGSADALSTTEIAITWPAATNVEGTPAALMLYHVYRFQLNPGMGQTFADVPAPSETNFTYLGSPQRGATSFVDNGIIEQPGTSTFSGTNVFYWVRAEDPQGRKSLSQVIAGANVPLAGSGDTMVYGSNEGTPHYEFANMTDDAGRTCLSCHTVTPGQGSLDLDTWEGIMTGTGTSSAPDTFVVPYQAEMTWANFMSGITSNPAHHLLYLSQANEILAWKDNVIGPWVEDGALNSVDLEPPIFEFDSIHNAGQYSAEFTSFNEVTVTWFQATDPESSPYGSGGETAAGQIDYYVYYGPNSNAIDWDNPVQADAWNGAGAHSVVIPGYTQSEIAIVVRGKDKTDNWTVNEKEIRLRR